LGHLALGRLFRDKCAVPIWRAVVVYCHHPDRHHHDGPAQRRQGVDSPIADQPSQQQQTTTTINNNHPPPPHVTTEWLLAKISRILDLKKIRSSE
jgi:hypothetical protein